ncbi:MAG: hypothetical protein ABIJ46_03320 [bacterium]
MPHDSRKKFIALVDCSALDRPDKDDLKRRAAAGVTPELWHRFDELLVAAFEARREALDQYRELLDQEVVRYTRTYEREKRVIDSRMRVSLAKLKSGDRVGHDRLWDEYHQRIARLQGKLLAEMKETSRTSLLQAVSAIPQPGQSW